MQLYFFGTNIEGNIESLSELTKLRELALQQFLVGNHSEIVAHYTSSIYGEIATLASLDNLENLSISECDVSGDLSSLQSLEKLYDAYFSFTKVYGEAILSNGKVVYQEFE